MLKRKHEWFGDKTNLPYEFSNSRLGGKYSLPNLQVSVKLVVKLVANVIHGTICPIMEVSKIELKLNCNIIQTREFLTKLKVL